MSHPTLIAKLGLYRLTVKAFRSVLIKKQSKYGHLIAWLDDAMSEATSRNRKEAARLNGIANTGNAIFRDYKY